MNLSYLFCVSALFALTKVCCASVGSYYELYASAWNKQHHMWRGDISNDVACSGGVSFPTCIFGVSLDYPHNACPAMTCRDNIECMTTPQDTTDYIPPPIGVDSTSSICGAPETFEAEVNTNSYGLEGGIPPHFSHIQIIPLLLKGVVSGYVNGQCVPLTNASIDVWQLDAMAYSSAIDTDINDAALREKSCRGRTDTSFYSEKPDGSYNFSTTLPPSYGPPRHINFMVTADGYETLITRLYFDKDSRLHQLTVLNGSAEDTALLNEQHIVQDSAFTDRYQDGFHKSVYSKFRSRFPGAVGRDPRVSTLKFVNTSIPSGGVVSGYYTTEFNIVLTPLRSLANSALLSTTSSNRVNQFGKIHPEVATNDENALNNMILPINLTGLWADMSTFTSSSISSGGGGGVSGGGLIKIDSFGNRFIAIEYPHPRNWGTVTGFVMGDVVHGIDFRTAHISNSINNANRPASSKDFEFDLNDLDLDSLSTFRNSIQYIPIGSVANRINDTRSNAVLLKQRTTLDQSSSNVFGSDLTTGVIVNKDPTSSSPLAATIHWYGAGGLGGRGGSYAGFWARRESLRPYRYLKLKIIRETGGYNGKLVINEIRFYSGVTAQNEIPSHDRKMVSPRTPFPQVVSCSSFERQEYHCYKAFDGIDSAPGNAWVTKAVGSKDHVLSNPQWVIVDMGVDRGTYPTSVRITCDIGNTGPNANATFTTFNHTSTVPVLKGCPMTFAVSGSYDNIKYNTLYTKDLFDYDNDYGKVQYEQMRRSSVDLSSVGVNIEDGVTVKQVSSATVGNSGDDSRSNVGSALGIMYDFFWEAPVGYPNGHRCGSCFTPPYFKCNLNAMDGTCSSGYCAYNGVCNELPQCPVGSYLEKTFTAHNEPIYKCKQCPGGTFGAEVGLTNPQCSGSCKIGYYCPVGSTSPDEIPCGSIHVFCPVASSEPIPASSGWKTVTLLDGDNGAANNIKTVINGTLSETQLGVYYNKDVTVRSSEVLCSPGHYCIGGVEYPCPLGTYGNASGLQTSHCTGRCVPGEYCPEGSVVPTLCPKGSYCPTGEVYFKCPPGVYGAMRGAKAPTCSGKCAIGFYCPSGSTSRAQVACPAGRYGSDMGLSDESCSGLCSPGYYCPAGSVNSTQFSCGGVDVYCPAGSSRPRPVSNGFYSTEGAVSSSDRLMAAQSLCERGFYCNQGVKKACPAGTYGDMDGLSLENMRVIDTEVLDVTRDDDTYAVVTAITTATPSSSPTTASVVNTSVVYNENAWCSGYCARGFYCPLNSTSPYQVPCPAGRYGNRVGLKDAKCSGVCPLGHYCPSGSVIPQPCRSGIFGNRTGLTSHHCNPYCYDNKMVMSSQIIGLADLGLSSSLLQEDVAKLSLVQQQQLVSSQFNNDNCRDNLCEAGYYCREASISAREHECGSVDVFCPIGSSQPTPVQTGYYTITSFSAASYAELSITGVSGGSSVIPDDSGTTDMKFAHVRTSERKCEPGHYCVGGVRYPCPAGVYGESSGLSDPACTDACPIGFYCPESTVDKFEYRCPAGRYGSVTGLTDSSCSGRCTAGYYCPEQSTSPTQIECGYNNSIPNSVFCYEGSTAPSVVHPGFYSVGNDRTRRTDEVECPLGAYCSEGIVFDCPAGRYGITSRLETSNCSGLCQAGFYCPPGSTSRNEIPCPKGRYGSTQGLSSQKCSGACQNPLYCLAGYV